MRRVFSTEKLLTRLIVGSMQIRYRSSGAGVAPLARCTTVAACQLFRRSQTGRVCCSLLMQTSYGHFSILHVFGRVRPLSTAAEQSTDVVFASRPNRRKYRSVYKFPDFPRTFRWFLFQTKAVPYAAVARHDCCLERDLCYGLKKSHFSGRVRGSVDPSLRLAMSR